MTRNETPRPRRNLRRGEPSAEAPDPLPTASGVDAATTPARQRIAKAMARAGLCSRREAEAWVLAGRVSVNGEVLASPARDIGPDDTVLIDGQPLPTAEKTRLFLFHKPRGLVTSDHDPEGRDTVTDFLRDNWPEGPRVVTVGRLDINTEGLLLLTNDGGLARMLELPETGWLRRYRVRAKGETDQSALDALAAGIEIDGIDYAGIDAKLDRLQGSNCWLTMGLREGKNREIKRVLEHIGLEVNRLIRLSFGPFQLLDLPEGAVEEVKTRVLRDQLGEKLAAAAGVDFGGDDAAVRQGATGEHERSERDAGRRPGSRAPTLSLSGRTSSSRTAPGPAGRQQDQEETEPAPERRERSQEGPRRHISALRATEAMAQRTGPRKRIERTATRDRHDRSVAVERLVTRDTPPRSPGRKKTSLSAEAKRVRVARSGGERPARHDDDDTRGARPRTFRGESGRNAAPPEREARRAPGKTSEGSGQRFARPKRDDAAPVRRDRPPEGRGRSAPLRTDRRDSGERSSASGATRPPRRSGPPADREQGERRSERPSRFAGASRERSEDGAGAGKRSFGKSSPGKAFTGRPTSDGAPSRRPSPGGPPSGKPFSKKPASDGAPSRRPSPGRPPSGKPSSGRLTSDGAPSRRPPSGRPPSGKPFTGRSSSDGAQSRRPPSGRPPSGKPSSGKPRSGKPFGKPNGRPGGSTKPKR